MTTQPHPLDAWLARRKKSRQWLADEAGTTRATISRIINGKQWPSRGLVASIAGVTAGAVTANDFLALSSPKRQTRAAE